MLINLRLAFDGNGGRRVSFNFPHADIDASAAQVKTLMQAIVANGDIYADVPQAPLRAEFFIREVRPIDIS